MFLYLFKGFLISFWLLQGWLFHSVVLFLWPFRPMIPQKINMKKISLFLLQIFFPFTVWFTCIFVKNCFTYSYLKSMIFFMLIWPFRAWIINISRLHDEMSNNVSWVKDFLAEVSEFNVILYKNHHTKKKFSANWAFTSFRVNFQGQKWTLSSWK